MASYLSVLSELVFNPAGTLPLYFLSLTVLSLLLDRTGTFKVPPFASFFACNGDNSLFFFKTLLAWLSSISIDLGGTIGFVVFGMHPVADCSAAVVD